jgi:HD-GYP domain-containing protein (c-di-GMP phosphodiesterase class II)
MADFCLIGRSDAGSVKHALVPPGPVTVGRLPQCQLVLEHAQVSRTHARLEWLSAEKRWRVGDAGSQGGTRVNGRRLAQGEIAVLEHGDQVAFGPVVLECVAGSADLGATLMGGDDGAEQIEWLKAARSEDLSHRHLALLLDLNATFDAAIDEASTRAKLVEGASEATGFANVAFVLRPTSDDDIRVAVHVGEVFDRDGRPRMSRSVLRQAREGLVLVTDKAQVSDAAMAASLERVAAHQAFCIPVGERGAFGFLYADNGSSRGDEAERKRLEEAANVAYALVRMAAASLERLHRAREMERLWRATLQLVVDTVENRDKCTGGHSTRVAELARLVGRAAGLDEGTCALIYECGRVHDIGKVAVPDGVLNKPGRLDEDEFKQVMAHPTVGFNMLRGHPLMQDVLPGVLEHHEKWNGTGYPSGLKEESISVIGRVIAVADVFDALTCERPYRSAMPVEKARAIIGEGAGSHFDPAFVKAFLTIPVETLARHMESGRSGNG